LTALHSAWTQRRTAPWSSPSLRKKNRHPVRFAGLATLERFDRQLRAVFKPIKDLSYFCGTTGTLGSHQQDDDESTAFRLCVVLWSPGFLSATKGEPEGDSPEVELQMAIQRHWSLTRRLSGHESAAGAPLLDIYIAYVIPRWRRKSLDPPLRISGGGGANRRPSALTRVDPRLLASGMWQLGVRLCMIRPHAVFSATADTSRVLAALTTIGQELPDPQSMADKPPLRVQERQTVNGLRRRLAAGEGCPGVETLSHSFPHFRCPHPYSMTGARYRPAAAAAVESVTGEQQTTDDLAEAVEDASRARARAELELLVQRTYEEAIKRQYCLPTPPHDDDDDDDDDDDIPTPPRKRSRLESPRGESDS
jgi:hypothetical protein